MAFYYCNEDDRVYSTDELRNDYALFENDYETFENYLSACMWWNNGALKPLVDHINNLKRRLRKVLSFVRSDGIEWYADEIDILTAQITHYEMFKEVI